MDRDLEHVLEKQMKRYALLRRLYQLTGANEQTTKEFAEVVTSEQLSPEDAEEALLYLVGESLIKRSPDASIAITHQGILEIEQSITNPEGGTEHFSAPIIQQSQSLPIRTQAEAVIERDNPDLAEALQQIARLHQEIQSLPSDQQELAALYLEDLRADLVSPNDNPFKIESAKVTQGLRRLITG